MSSFYLITVPSPEVTVSTGFPLDEAIGSPSNVSCVVNITTTISAHDDTFIQGKLVLGMKQNEMIFMQKLNQTTATTYTFNHTIKNVVVSDGGIYNCTAALVYKGSNDFVLNSNITSSSSSLYISSKF